MPKHWPDTQKSVKRYSYLFILMLKGTNFRKIILDFHIPLLLPPLLRSLNIPLQQETAPYISMTPCCFVCCFKLSLGPRWCQHSKFPPTCWSKTDNFTRVTCGPVTLASRLSICSKTFKIR